MVFIVPNFQKIFLELLGDKDELPALTQFVMNLSNMIKNEGWIFLVAGAIIFILYKVTNNTKYGKWGIDWVKYNMPLIGPIISRSSISRFARTLGTLMSSGVPVLGALIIVRDTAGNDVVSTAVQKVHDAVKEGEGIATPLGATGIFPQMVISMVEVGEETGKLPDMLEKVANTYDEEVDNAVGALTSMIEPIMIVCLAVVVGTIVIAMFMPLVKLIESLGG
jgi:type IV pilus assembly protein PilC